MTKVFIHGSGHKSSSWNEVVKNMHYNEDILCPDLSSILNGKEASYSNLYSSFIDYCNKIEGEIDLCGLSLGGILALNYAIEYPGKVKSLVLIGTPYKVPKFMFRIQNIIFRLFTKINI
ncbi:alpha/beta hydrolase [Clostridium sp. C1]|uniref:alpha/beta fold hydrolase n=1 Tax=Clostridium sp. C1 TaxID=1155388 RepID=UPI0020124FB6|nr:alpha/beta hydrolase [Clostridium sp. C1]